MSTTNTDFLPNVSGLNLGSPDQQWDGFFGDITVAGDVIFDGIFVASGNATKIQGRPILANAPVLNQALIWNGTAWAPQNQSGGGGGATLGYVVVPFSATPTFTSSPVGSCGFDITLTGNVTSSTFTTAGVAAGCIFNFVIRQDGTGGRTFAWPALAKGTQPVATTASMITVAGFLWDGTNLLATSFPMSFL